MNYVDNPFNAPALLSFCPGIRGLERGLERALLRLGWSAPKTVAHVEIEAFIIENVVSQMEQGLLAPAPVWSNLKTFNALPFLGKVHGYIGGYPCQPFSNNGLRKGTEDPRHLWPYIRKHISTGRPLWCFFENVAGHLTMGYDEVYRDLRDLGYNVEAGVFTADEVGATQERERLFILAILADTPCDGIWGLSKREPGQEWSEQIKGFNANWKGKEIMADTEGIGVQGRRAEGEQVTSAHGVEGLSLRHSGNDRWPARPDEPQHEWEEPRIIESGMGCTINGHNFREDFLRALGNSVIEQQAEFAFINLLNKHYERTKHIIR